MEFIGFIFVAVLFYLLSRKNTKQAKESSVRYAAPPEDPDYEDEEEPEDGSEEEVHYSYPDFDADKTREAAGEEDNENPVIVRSSEMHHNDRPMHLPPHPPAFAPGRKPGQSRQVNELCRLFGEDRRHDWMARELREESLHMVWNNFTDLGARHAHSCAAEEAREEHRRQHQSGVVDDGSGR